MNFVTTLSMLLLFIWNEEYSFIGNVLGNLMLIGMGIFLYFFFPWVFSKYGPDEFEERESPD